MPHGEMIGVYWYTREHYETMRTICIDEENFHATYDEWLEDAEKFCKQMENDGVKVVRTDLDPDRFLAFCKSKGMKPNASTRNWIATEAVLKVIRQG